MATAAATAPVNIDEPALFRLADAGYLWTEGQSGLVRFRWLLPPGWVVAATLPPKSRTGIEPLRGVGDRQGRFTAVLAVLRDCGEAPHRLLQRSAAANATIALFSSRSGPVAERIESRDGRITVTTIHAFAAGGAPYRFLISAFGPDDSAPVRTTLRTLGTALSLADDLDRFRAGRLHG